jgi:hypothetical protein
MKDVITNHEGNGETKGLTDIQSVLPIKVDFFDIVSQVTKKFMSHDPAYDGKNSINVLDYDNKYNRFFVFSDNSEAEVDYSQISGWYLINRNDLKNILSKIPMYPLRTHYNPDIKYDKVIYVVLSYIHNSNIDSLSNIYLVYIDDFVPYPIKEPIKTKNSIDIQFEKPSK